MYSSHLVPLRDIVNEAGELTITAALVLYKHNISRDRNAIMCTQAIS